MATSSITDTNSIVGSLRITMRARNRSVCLHDV